MLALRDALVQRDALVDATGATLAVMLPLPTILVVVVIVGSVANGWSLANPEPWGVLAAGLRVLATALILALAWLIHALPLGLAALAVSLVVGAFVRRRSPRTSGAARRPEAAEGEREGAGAERPGPPR